MLETGNISHLEGFEHVLDARVVHLDAAAQMVDLGHDVEVPLNVPYRTCCLRIAAVCLKELVTFV